MFETMLSSDSPKAFVAVAVTCVGEQMLGVGSEVMGRQTLLPLVTLCRPVKLLGIPVTSITTTSKYCTGSSGSEYTLKHRKLSLWVTSGLSGGSAAKHGKNQLKPWPHWYSSKPLHAYSHFHIVVNTQLLHSTLLLFLHNNIMSAIILKQDYESLLHLHWP